MSTSETVPQSPESDMTQISFDETELTLGLPGNKVNAKRGFHNTVDAGVGSSTSEPRDGRNEPELVSSGDGQKRAVMGWPPVRSYRRKTIEMRCKYVKVAADGAPYLRKLDLEMFNGYQDLFIAFEELFTSFPICYKDGDWMLVGDVPWKLFIESCKRIRLMKGSDTIGAVMALP
ncbi:Auxin-responsive protein IAA11 [Cucurbita argyrosperma subsp. argyrosperma]|nr:Auxin-responsive protein IAA11 [Cucurbita argyrosperma subsp. argyrosperma]